MKRLCSYVYDKGGPECSKLCDPYRGQLKQCMRECPDYFKQYHDKIMPNPQPCNGFQYYESGAETCEPCEKLCNSIASLEDCKLSCPEFFKYYNCTLSKDAGVRGDACSCDDVILALSITIVVLVICLFIVAGFAIKLYRCRHAEPHKEEAHQRDEESLLELTSDATATSHYFSSSDTTDTKSLGFSLEDTETFQKKEGSVTEMIELQSLCNRCKKALQSRGSEDADSLNKDDQQSTGFEDKDNHPLRGIQPTSYLCKDRQKFTALDDTEYPSEDRQRLTARDDTALVCEYNQQNVSTFQSPPASSSDGYETTRLKELVTEPFSSTNTVQPVLRDTPTDPSSFPGPFSLHESVSTYHGTASSGSADATPGPSTIRENWNRPISQQDIEYLVRQVWVRILMINYNRTEVEIMVSGISLEDATIQIRDNTNLGSSRYILTDFIDCLLTLLNGTEALDIANLIFFKETQSDKGPRVSTIGGYLEHPDTDSIYLITSAHNSSKGTEYFCDRRMRPEDFIGKCKYWFCDDDLDIAFIELEDISPRNIIYLLSNKPGVSIEYKPWLVDETVSGRCKTRDLLKHSRKVDRGELCEIRKSGMCHRGMRGPPGESGLGNEGDSGSLITSSHVRLSKQGKYLPAVGLASRRELLIRKFANRFLITEVCIFTPIWPSVRKIAQTEGINPTKFRFLEPGSRKLSGTQRVVMKDTGYQSSPSKLQT